MKLHYLFFSLIVFTFFFSSCSDEIEEVENISLDLDFYPLEQELFWVYQMDSIIHDNDGRDRFETTSFLRERITDSFVSESGDTIYQLEVSWKENLSDSWQFQRNWSVFKSNNRLIKNEDNLRFVKMIFPPAVGATWDGNIGINDNTIVQVSGESLEMFKNWDYQVLGRENGEQIGVRTYDEVLTVEQANFESAIEIRTSEEKYAKGIGLVYRSLQILDTQCFACDTQTWDEKAERGFELVQTLIESN